MLWIIILQLYIIILIFKQYLKGYVEHLKQFKNNQ